MSIADTTQPLYPLDDSTYRDRLGRLYGVPSAKDLTTSEASDLIEKLSAAKTKRG